MLTSGTDRPKMGIMSDTVTGKQMSSALYTGLQLHRKLFYCGIGRQEVLLMHQSAKEDPSFPLGNRLYIRLGLYSRGKTFHTPSEEKEDYSACMLRKAEQTLLRL